MVYIFLAVLVAGAGYVVSRLPGNPFRKSSILLGLFIGLFLIATTSYVYIGDKEVGHLSKVYGYSELKNGAIIAANGEKGPQAEILPPGFHFRPLLRVIYNLSTDKLVEIPEGKYGFLEARDGVPLRPGQFLADPWPEKTEKQMLEAEFFLKNGGQKGPQTTVLKPGNYRINKFLWNVKLGPATFIPAGHVGVVKSNLAVRTEDECIPIKTAAGALNVPLVPKGCIGVWDTVLYPGAYYMNHKAYKVDIVDTRVQTWVYKGGYLKREVILSVNSKGEIVQKEERPIRVIKPDDAADRAIFLKVEGWDIPVDARVLVQVTPENAPIVVASVGGLRAIEDKIMTPAIRSVARNVAGTRAVFDLQDQRDKLETDIEAAIRPEGLKAGVEIKEVRLGEPYLPPSLRTPRLRTQLATELETTFEKEKVAQQKRQATEEAKARADQQVALVTADIQAEAALKVELRREREGNAEKKFLTNVAKGQEAQANVLGKDLVMRLRLAEMIIDAIKEKPQILTSLRLPSTVVVGGGSGLEGAAAVFSQALNGKTSPVKK